MPAPTELYHDTIPMEFEMLHSVTPDPNQPDTLSDAFPMPKLSRSGKTVEVPISVVTLKNDFVVAKVAVELGGRLISLQDARTGVECLSSRLWLEDIGPRGVSLAGGIEIGVGEFPRRTAMASPYSQIREPYDEDPVAAVQFFEIVHGTGMSLQWTWSLAPRSTELNLEVVVRNRTCVGVPGLSGLRVWGRGVLGTQALWIPQGDLAGVRVGFERTGFDLIEPLDKATDLKRRVLVVPMLSGRQSDRFVATFAPISTLGTPVAMSAEAAIGTSAQGVHACATTESITKAFVQVESGQTLEAEIDLAPGQSTTIALDQKIIAGQLRKADGTDCFAPESPVKVLAETEFLHNEREVRHEFETGWRLQTREGSARPAAYIKLAQSSWMNGESSLSDGYMDDALLYQSDDPLAWWHKAVLTRNYSDELELEESQELLNAHFLAPLEPALRAESFLRITARHAEPSPLTKPLADSPDDGLEVIELYIEAGFWSEANRLADEILRHRSIPAIHAMMAWTYLRTRMEAEAARHMKLADDGGFGAPYPYSDVARQLVNNLQESFPESSWVRAATALLQATEI